MRVAVVDANVLYSIELTDLLLINVKDRHVLALAVLIEADCLVTFDLRDFPAALCEPHGVEPLHPDELLDALAAAEPGRAIAVVREMASRRRRPPMTAAQVLDRLERLVPKFVARCRPLT